MHSKSTKRSSFSTSATVKTNSFFCNSLEEFSKYDVLKNVKSASGKGNQVKKIDNLTQLSENEIESDLHLANWERWLNVHKRQQEQLSMKLKRPTQSIVMNSNLSSLYTNQEKRIISDATNLILCDKYRGHPNFWKTDDNTKNDGKSLGFYQTKQEKYDRSNLNCGTVQCSLPTQLEYVGVPDAIYNEKGLDSKPCLPTPKEKWERSVHVVNKKELLKTNLDIVQEHKPELSNVVVVGTKYVNKLAPDTEIIVEPDQKECQISNTCECTITNLQTKIPISVFVDDEICHENSTQWIILFDDCNINENYEKTIVFHNTGESSLRYAWELVLPKWAGNKIPLKHLKVKSKCFYFNKIDGTILPKNKMDLVINFKSDVAGVFNQKWEILFSDESDQWKSSTLELQAVATEKHNNMDALNAIDSYLESCTRLTIARKTVKEILDRQKPISHQKIPYDWNFFEEQIFVYNNPELFYDSKCVVVLKNLYAKLNEGPWDYSVKNLRRKLLQKSSNGNLTDEIDVYVSTIYQLMKPNPSSSLLNEKHKSVNELLCCFFNKMEYEGTALKCIYNIPERFKHVKDVHTDNMFKKLSMSARLSAKVSLSSRKISSKKSLIRNKLSIEKHAMTSIEKCPIEPVLNSKFNASLTIEKKQEFLEALYVKTYNHLSQMMDNISVIIDSFDSQKKERAFIALRRRNI